MVIIDTSVWIDYLRGGNKPESLWLDRELKHQPLGLTDLILCEVLQGTGDSDFSQVQSDLLKFHIFPNCSTRLALAAAQNYRTLRKKGYTVRKTIDCLIATFCLENGHSLLHLDRDFDLFEQVLGLHVVHP
jgi:predicted nucleic acid-binding protein